MPLCDLLDYLAQDETPADHKWHGWHITHINGGWNNLLYRARDAEHDYTIKFTIRDTRNRAGREFAALTALRDAGLQIAPNPILYEPDRYKLPVVVQTWIAGQVSDAMPGDDETWMHLLEHYARIHTLTPDQTQLDLPVAVVTAHDAKQAQARAREQLALLPSDARPESLVALMNDFAKFEFPSWQTQHVTFCRVDPNITNFLRGENLWRSVDWENAGWGDPAYEIADMIAHPAYDTISSARWDWVIENICALENDSQMAGRIRTYYGTILLWWVVRWARYAYETPRGQDGRLVNRPANWAGHVQTQFTRYLEKANAIMQKSSRG